MTFSVAVNTGWGDNQVTSWWNVIHHGKNSEKLVELLRKKTLVVCDGEISVDKTTGAPRLFQHDGATKSSLDLSARDVTILEYAEKDEAGSETTEEEPDI